MWCWRPRRSWEVQHERARDRAGPAGRTREGRGDPAARAVRLRGRPGPGYRWSRVSRWLAAAAGSTGPLRRQAGGTAHGLADPTVNDRNRPGRQRAARVVHGYAGCMTTPPEHEPGDVVEQRSLYAAHFRHDLSAEPPGTFGEWVGPDLVPVNW